MLPQAMIPVPRSTTLAGHQEAAMALGLDARLQTQRVSSLFGVPATNGTAQFVSDQYMQMNDLAVPTLFSAPPISYGQLCSTFGQGQPGTGTMFGCVSYADNRALLAMPPSGQVVGLVPDQLRLLSGQMRGQ